jgi:hypothetical protein
MIPLQQSFISTIQSIICGHKCVSFVLVGIAGNVEQIWYMMIFYIHMTLLVFQQDT